MSSTPEVANGNAQINALPGLSLASRLTSNVVRSPLFFFFTALFGCISLALSLVEKDGRLQHRVARLWARVSLWIAGASVTVIGHENIVPLAVYTSNHTSLMDTPLVFRSLPFQFRILAKQSLWKWPFIGWHLQRSGQIPVDEESSSGSVAGLNRAIRALKSGMPLFSLSGGRPHFRWGHEGIYAWARIHCHSVPCSPGSDRAGGYLRIVAHSYPSFPSQAGEAGLWSSHRSCRLHHPAD